MDKNTVTTIFKKDKPMTDSDSSDNLSDFSEYITTSESETIFGPDDFPQRVMVQTLPYPADVETSNHYVPAPTAEASSAPALVESTTPKSDEGPGIDEFAGFVGGGEESGQDDRPADEPRTDEFENQGAHEDDRGIEDEEEEPEEDQYDEQINAMRLEVDEEEISFDWYDTYRNGDGAPQNVENDDEIVFDGYNLQYGVYQSVDDDGEDNDAVQDLQIDLNDLAPDELVFVNNNFVNNTDSQDSLPEETLADGFQIVGVEEEGQQFHFEQANDTEHNLMNVLNINFADLINGDGATDDLFEWDAEEFVLDGGNEGEGENVYYVGHFGGFEPEDTSFPISLSDTTDDELIYKNESFGLQESTQDLELMDVFGTNIVEQTALFEEMLFFTFGHQGNDQDNQQGPSNSTGAAAGTTNDRTAYSQIGSAMSTGTGFREASPTPSNSI